MNGKGDKPRQVDGDKYRSNYDKIFRKQCKFYAYEAPLGKFETIEESETHATMQDENGNVIRFNKKALEKLNCNGKD